ncbi:unnamed protein product [Sphenostylis stenocarpa]|uniref:Uncharacterized protein n=1 Tax=Sphenostylis stenocarpa TaxID=92480 RepID=A0AA86SQH6_9FABA|nr:unnamed protein product [Sphenostylis stenocarpa]
MAKEVAAVSGDGDGDGARVGSLAPLSPASSFCNSRHGTFRMLNLPCQGDFHSPYLKNFLKKRIAQIELDHGYVLDNLYELYAHYMASFKGREMSESAKEFRFFFLKVNSDSSDVSPFILMMLFHSPYLWLVSWYG